MTDKKKIILMAESGADIPREFVEKYGLRIVPMHVSFGSVTKDDGFFPVEDLFDYYEQTKELPKTSGCTPADFEKAFDEVHAEYPNCHIIHLAYSAATTCSYQSALIAAEGRDYVTSIDTKHVTVGQGMIVLALANYLENHPDCTVEEAVEKAHDYCRQCRMSFFPGTLIYLKAGGRVSNAAYLGAKVLSLTPLIEMKDGKLVATRKYRGKKEKIVRKLVEDYVPGKALKKDFISFVYAPGITEELRDEITGLCKEMGFAHVVWFQTGGVISTHSGPGGFGICGFSDQAQN